MQLVNGSRSDHVNFNSATTPHHKLGCTVPSTFILTLESHFSNMPKLYYTPVTSGPASFIAAVVAGVHISVEQIDMDTHRTASGEDFYKINPKGTVPTLVLDDGTVLNEGSAILQWIADQVQRSSI
jgi:hypothetical protein